jgi:NAD-dependent DNA ligase
VLKGVGGWSEGSLNELLAVLPAALAWSVPFGHGPGPAAASATSSPVGASAAPSASSPVGASAAPTKFVVFTGVRDKALEETIQAKGWSVDPAVTKKTTVLVIADDDAKETGKVKKAREAGIRIMRISEFRTFALAN